MAYKTVIVKGRKKGDLELLGRFKNLSEAKKYWIQGDNILRQMVKNKEVTFEEVK